MSADGRKTVNNILFYCILVSGLFRALYIHEQTTKLSEMKVMEEKRLMRTKRHAAAAFKANQYCYLFIANDRYYLY